MFDTADATADLLQLQRTAMLERCGITVEPHDGGWGVKQHEEWIIGYLTEIDAYCFAWDMAADQIDQGDLS